MILKQNGGLFSFSSSCLVPSNECIGSIAHRWWNDDLLFSKKLSWQKYFKVNFKSWNSGFRRKFYYLRISCINIFKSKPPFYLLLQLFSLYLQHQLSFQFHVFFFFNPLSPLRIINICLNVGLSTWTLAMYQMLIPEENRLSIF